MDSLTQNIIKIFFLLFMIGVPILIILQIYKNKLLNRKIEWMTKMRFMVLRILVPKNNEKTPLAAEQMFAALHGIFQAGKEFQEYVSFEIAARDKYIYFYVCTPTHLKDFVQGQIYAQYPTAEIAEVDDYTREEIEAIKTGQMKIAATELELVNEDVYPIKSFMNFEVDPLSAITSALSKIERGEQIWIQMLVKPVADDWQDKGTAHIKAMKSGSLKRKSIGLELLAAFGRAMGAIIVTILSGTTPESSKAQKAEEIKLSGTQEAGLSGVETKVTKLGYSTKIRLVSLAPNENSARAKIMEVMAAFKQFNLLNLNGFQIGEVTNSIDAWKNYNERQFLEDSFILNTEELASIFHLPSVSVATPNIVWAGSKKGEPPSNLPIEENVGEEDLTVFARTDFRHLQHKFGIKIPDRRYHMYVIGKTGTGKSTMLENMIVDDIREGRGVAVVDPHGDLIKHTLEYIPEDRIKDVVYFSPADRLYPVAFNPLENVDPDMKSIVASGVVGIFKKIFGESWGPRLEYILRNTVLALLDVPGATMMGITRILVDKPFREKVLSQVKDPVIKDFFVNEFEQYEPKLRTEAVSPIQNKVGQFLSSATIRNIVAQPKSTIDLKDIMDSGKILLVNLSVGEIGEDASSLLGSLMITKIQLTAMNRAVVPEDERRDFYLYVDEFQNFATESFATILSEARKYHLNLIMAHQYIAQMLEPVRDAVIGNVGTIVSFRIGAPDAEFLQKEFEPIFEANDMVNLDNYHVYIKMSIDGVTCPAFSAVTLPRSATKFGYNDRIIEHSRQNYSRRREFVEEQIEKISDMPKVDEILTKSEKKLVVKIPPKIGETYYREIQTVGDTRWYFGGGTSDQPLNDDTIKEKIAKTQEKAVVHEEKLEQWQKDRLAALETSQKENNENTLAAHQAPSAMPSEQVVVEKNPGPSPVQSPAQVNQNINETGNDQKIEFTPSVTDDETEKDKQMIIKTLKDGETIKINEHDMS